MRLGYSRVEKTHFIVYSNGKNPFSENADNYCAAAKRVGFDSASHITEETIRETSFWNENKLILEQPRGAGYWLWKPWIVLQKLLECGPNDVVVYNDAGRQKPGSFNPFPAFPYAAIELCAMTPNRFIHGFMGEWQVQGQYTKRDAFILMEADTDEMRLASQICAGPLIFMPSSESFNFLERWISFCRDPRILTDQPSELGQSYSEFRDHRHDQAVGSILAHKMKAHYFDFSKNGAYSAVKDIEKRNKHVLQPQTHIGYVSLMASRALPDDFLQGPDPDLTVASTLLRNLTPHEPIPTHNDRPTHEVLLSQLENHLVQPDTQIGRDHFLALLEKYKFSNWRGFYIRKFPDEAPKYWEKSLDFFKAELTNKRKEDSDISASDAFRIAVASLRSTDAKMPEFRRKIMSLFIWKKLSADSQKSFISKYKRINSTKATQALSNFCDLVYDLDIISFEAEISGIPDEVTKGIEASFTEWMQPE